MAVLTFKGGIHPHNDGKDLSKATPITDYTPVGEIVIPMAQHIGAPASPLVKKGDRVLVNQKIGAAAGFISANIHSPVSGIVKNVEPRLTAGGTKVLSVIIENDGMNETVPVTDERGAEDLTKEEKLNLIQEAGIVGMGGAGFPTNVKLSPKNADEIEYYIVNGAECEPYLTSDYRRMIESPEAIVKGVKIALSLFGKAKAIIAIEDNKRDAIVKMKEAVKGDPDIAVKTVYTKYPQGGERMLIRAVTGRYLNSRLLPADRGCIVMNVASVLAAYGAISCGRPLTHCIMTVTGDAVSSPCNLEVPVGTSYAAVLAEAGGFSAEPEKVISGGPMMGTALFSLDIPVTKTASSILALRHDPVALHDASPCIHCGHCLHACPEGLVPQLLSVAAEQEQFDVFEKYGGMECIECGSCAFVCPAGRHLVQSMRYGKRQTGALIRARKAAEISNQTVQKGGAGK